jgi:YidC/Oxa1 family membrane protein insertase
MTVIALMPQPLIDAAHSALVYLHGILSSWGLAIIALTVAVRLVILPLTFKQVRGMQDMQRHAPELKKIQERYKEDPQRRNEETMKYYKEHQFNPLSSCLPLALQIPVFITLFDVLKKGGPFSQDIAAAGDPSFLFITNLAAPETGAVLVLLMALYIATQLGSSMVSMVSAEKTQKRVMLALPFVFVSVVIYFPAGLVVYWITTNLWTIGQQLAVKKFLPSPAPGGGGDGAKDASSSSSGGGDGLAKSLSARVKGKTATPESGGANGGGPQKSPPPSPRKKKKRSGRRR